MYHFKYSTYPLFRLIDISLRNHYVLGDVDFKFHDDDSFEEAGKPYSTVIIGVNGIGKSYLLGVILDIFEYLRQLIESDVTPVALGYQFRISYFLDGNIFSASTIDQGEVSIPRSKKVIDRIQCEINSEYSAVTSIVLPERTMASTMTVTDKFSSKSTDHYKYHGIRDPRTPGIARTKTLVRNTVGEIVRCLSEKEGYRDELKMLLSFLGLEDEIVIKYGIRHKKQFITNKMTSEHLADLFVNYKSYFNRKSELWGSDYFKKHVLNNSDLLGEIVDFLKHASQRIEDGELSYSTRDNALPADARVIDALSKLDILTFPQINVRKKGQYFSFDYSSSGELQVLCQMIGILSDIQNNSLVIIDEPETSTHPSWQINYLRWLNRIFEKYSSCHFVIATHSHLLLSDLEPKSSCIIPLKRDNENRLVSIQGVNTYCWSSDDILYRVFKVNNTRNYVFEAEFMELYQLISNRDNNHKRVKDLYNNLCSYELNYEDPIANFLRKVKSYVETL